MQIALTEVQVSLLAGAAGNAMLDADGAEREALSALTDFLKFVEAVPERFLAPAKFARSLKKVRPLKGEAQPRPNRRKWAQIKAQGAQKRTRAQRRADAVLYNEARDAALEVFAIEQAQADRARAEAAGIVLPEST